MLVFNAASAVKNLQFLSSLHSKTELFSVPIVTYILMSSFTTGGQDLNSGSQYSGEIGVLMACHHISHKLRRPPARSFTSEQNDPFKTLEGIISQNSESFRQFSGLEVDDDNHSSMDDLANMFFDNATKVTEGLRALAGVHPAIGAMLRSISSNCG